MLNLLPSFYNSCLENQLSIANMLQLKILIWMLQTFKEVRIERLAALYPKPIRFESRRRSIQRFLMLKRFCISSIWFPLVKFLLKQQHQQFMTIYKSPNKRQKKRRKNPLWDYFLIAIDRTQWRDKNLFVVSIIWEKRAWPITGVLLDKKGSSNFSEQKKLIASILPILKKYKFVIIGDREFGSVRLANWLKGKKIKFVFRIKKSTHIELPVYGYQPLSSLELTSGNSLFLQDIPVTRQKGFGTFNVAGYWRRNYRNKKWNEPWYLLTNLSSLKQAKIAYKARFGIEAMFKDCKTGGYNLEGCHCNEARLINLVLLIALAYTAAAILGKKIKKSCFQKYISRLTEVGRIYQRHSNFWVGLYGTLWIAGLEFFNDLYQRFSQATPSKLLYFQQGLRVKTLIQSLI